jgi:hypothetical protein
MEVNAAISAQEGDFFRKIREEILDKYKENFVLLQE